MPSLLDPRLWFNIIVWTVQSRRKSKRNRGHESSSTRFPTVLSIRWSVCWWLSGNERTFDTVNGDPTFALHSCIDDSNSSSTYSVPRRRTPGLEALVISINMPVENTSARLRLWISPQPSLERRESGCDSSNLYLTVLCLRWDHVRYLGDGTTTCRVLVPNYIHITIPFAGYTVTLSSEVQFSGLVLFLLRYLQP